MRGQLRGHASNVGGGPVEGPRSPAWWGPRKTHHGGFTQLGGKNVGALDLFLYGSER